MKFLINPSATLLVKSLQVGTYCIQFLLDGSRLLHKFEVSVTGKRLLTALYTPLETREIQVKFGVSESEIADFLRPLIKAGLVVSDLDLVQPDHFGSRHTRTVEFFNSFSKPGNSTKHMAQKLFASKVLVLGLGGVGSWVVDMLARTGVKSLVLVDPDVVEVSNIPRQAMYTLGDVGELKVNVAERHCYAVSSSVQVTKVSQHMRAVRQLTKILPGVDLVINCADRPTVDKTNALVTHACFKQEQVPHILCGGYDGHLSSLGQTVIPGRSSCWFCYSESGVYERALDGFEIIERKSNEAVGGTISPIAVQIASMQVQEAVRVLTGCSQPVMLNRRAEVDFVSLKTRFTKVPKNKLCKVCGV